MTLLLVFITGSYVFLIAILIYGWMQVPEFRIRNRGPIHKFSIVICYRDEAENLRLLLNSFLKMKYPHTHYEIILVNDASMDNSRKICADFRNDHPHFRISLLENKRFSAAPKKDAITIAVKKANFNYIITSDADCVLPPSWLQAYNDILLETDALLVAGPVSSQDITNNNFFDNDSNESWEVNRANYRRKYLYEFQEMDVMSLQAAGIGTFGIDQPFMANGANLCYSRDTFLKLDGFKGNEMITSGDDVFLLQKFNQSGCKMAFLKCREAIVITQPQKEITSLISQRIRWAAKAPAYKSNFAKITGLVVLLMNISLVIFAFLVFMEFVSYEPVLLAFLFKFLADLVLLFVAARFFKRIEILRNYFWSSLVYPFFSSAIAIMSLFRKFEWKGRISGK